MAHGMDDGTNTPDVRLNRVLWNLRRHPWQSTNKTTARLDLRVPKVSENKLREAAARRKFHEYIQRLDVAMNDRRPRVAPEGWHIFLAYGVVAGVYVGQGLA